MNELNEQRLDLLSKNIEIILSSLGMSGQYIAYHYLHAIIFHMIATKDDSNHAYRTAIRSLMQEYSVSHRTIDCGLHKILDQCNNPEITSKPQFNLYHCALFNKVKVINSYVESILNSQDKY